MTRVTNALAAADSVARQARQNEEQLERVAAQQAVELARVAAQQAAEMTRVTTALTAADSLAIQARETEARLERIAAEQATEATRITAALAATDLLAIQARENEARFERVAAEQAAEATRVTAAIAGTEQGLSKLSGHVKRLETYIDTNAAVQRASRAFARKGISLHHRHRVALDLQACQTKDSRNRGIGKYSRSLAEAVVNADHGLDIVACFNQSYPESAEELAQQFEPILGPGRIGRYNAPASLHEVGAPTLDRGRLGGEWIAQYAWTAQSPTSSTSAACSRLDGLSVVPDLLGMPRTRS
jgi:hypothetical protein